jgi:hypothetical protein
MTNPKIVPCNFANAPKNAAARGWVVTILLPMCEDIDILICRPFLITETLPSCDPEFFFQDII